eukprot:jgi/Ulvmu1/1949/UM012_0110.1
MAEKGLEYESKQVNASKGEHKGPDVMEINPRGQVPTFKDGDIVVNESIAIMQYLEETYPEPALMPSDKPARALALQRFHEASSLYGAIQPLFYAKMVGKVNTDSEKELFQEGIKKANKELEYFESYLLDGREFIAGDMFTLADISVALTLFFAQRAGATFAQFPSIQNYAERLSSRPSIKDSWPPHWLETPGSDWLADL